MKLSLKTTVLLAIFTVCGFSRLSAALSDNPWPNIPEELRDKDLKLGYVALRESSTFLGNLVNGFKCQYSHCGIIVYEQGKDNPENWYCFEIRNQCVSIFPWNDSWWTKTPAKVSLRAILGSDIRSEAIKDEMNKYIGRPFSLKQALLGLFRENKNQDLNELFCTQVVALTFQSLGVLPSNRLANNYLAVDFSSSNKSLTLLNGVTLGEETPPPGQALTVQGRAIENSIPDAVLQTIASSFQSSIISLSNIRLDLISRKLANQSLAERSARSSLVYPRYLVKSSGIRRMNGARP